jgi:hypothetical protein
VVGMSSNNKLISVSRQSNASLTLGEASLVPMALPLFSRFLIPMPNIKIQMKLAYGLRKAGSTAIVLRTGKPRAMINRCAF